MEQPSSKTTLLTFTRLRQHVWAVAREEGKGVSAPPCPRPGRLGQDPTVASAMNIFHVTEPAQTSVPPPSSGWGCRKRSRLPPPLTATLVCEPDINGLKGPVMARDPCVLWPSHTSCFQEKRLLSSTFLEAP